MVSKLASLQWTNTALILLCSYGLSCLVSMGGKCFAAFDLRLWGWFYLRLRIGSPNLNLGLSKYISRTALILIGLWSAVVFQPSLLNSYESIN